MSLEKNIYFTKLFDIYGELLSKNQYEVMNDFLNNDLTLTEVAENKLITRQAVKDVVSKVEKKLLSFESKLHLLEKIEELEAEIKRLKNKED